MDFLKNLKLGSKITIGFSVSIISLLFIILFAYYGLNKNSSNFKTYTNLTQLDSIAGNMQTNILMCRLAFKEYFIYNNTTPRETFRTKYLNLEEAISSFSIVSSKSGETQKDPESAKLVVSILENAREFKQHFTNVITLQEQKTEIIENRVLDANDNILKYIRDIAEQEKEFQGTRDLTEIDESVRFFSNNSKYLQKNELDNIDDVKLRLSEMEDHIKYFIKSIPWIKYRNYTDLINKEKDSYINNLKDVIPLIEKRNSIISQMDSVGDKLSSQVDTLKLTKSKVADTYEPKAKRENDTLVTLMVFFALITLFSVIFITVAIVSIIIKPIRVVTTTFKGIAEGKADLTMRLNVNSNDEIGEMSTYFNTFMEKLQIILNENEKQSWLKTGQAELSEILRNEQNMQSLGAAVISYIAKYINANVGVIYHKSDRKFFSLIGTYAFNVRKKLSNEVLEKEGIVGEAAFEKQTILLTDVPDGYLNVNSGIGEGTPKNIVAVPCVYNTEVKGVVELGTFREFSALHLEFLNMVSENIGAAINAIETKEKTKELLEKTIQQAEELQAQQEELKQNNEELEEQTKALKESEMRLQQQQEELRVTNEELEERTKALEKQREEIANKNKTLIEAQKIIAQKAKDLELASKYKSEFLANMSHELRTPLNSILVLSKLLSNKKQNVALTEKELDYAKTIHSSGSDLLNLINDILDLSKVESGNMEVIIESMNIQDFGISIEKQFKHMAENKGLAFATNLQKGLPHDIFTDSQKVQQIIKNFISNAFKFTHNGGVTLIIRRPTKDEVTGSNLSSENSIFIGVQDTGIGIPDDKKGIIFEAFKQADGTTSRKYGGTGLGLSISKELTRLLGGVILLKSKENDGSTFAIILPERLQKIDKTETNNTEQNSSNTEIKRTETRRNTSNLNLSEDKNEKIVSTPIKKVIDDRDRLMLTDRTILIVEDDPNFYRILSDIAHEKGFKTLIAERGDEAITLAKKYLPSAIIADIVLPGLSGWKVIEKLQEYKETKDIPVHIISGQHLNEKEIIKNNIIGYLEKPVSVEKLDSTFKEIELIIEKPFKNLLIIETGEKEALSDLLKQKGIEITFTKSGESAIAELKNKVYDSIIMDLKLVDMHGIDFIKKMKSECPYSIPIIIYTDREITFEEGQELEKHTASIIIKGPRSLERLKSETMIFLHKIYKELLDTKSKKIGTSQNGDNSLVGKKILIVDDDMRNVFALTSILEEKGIKTIAGKNGKDGIDKLNQNPDIELILMDIMMPEMDGYAAIKEIRKKEGSKKKIPIIALTAKAMREDREKCIEAGASDYMTKPLDADKLVSLLKVWLYK